MYVGLLEKPLKDITDDDDDAAHVNAEADLEVQFYFADKEH